MDNTLPVLPGFDTAAAMKMLNNNAKLYGSVLKRFTKQYTESYPTLEAALKGTDWALIQREAHTIKGLAGTIGHPGLQEAARALESCVKSADAPEPAAVLPLADAFLAALSSVLGTLKAAYSE